MDESIARRSALDHLLGIVANAECGESLVLRGSMTMLAWVGEAARPPGDLDWIVRPLAGVPLDDLRGRSAGKDLYDAVLLAELGLPLSARLRRTIARRLPDPAVLRDIRRWTIDWSTLDGAPSSPTSCRTVRAVPGTSSAGPGPAERPQRTPGRPRPRRAGS